MTDERQGCCILRGIVGSLSHGTFMGPEEEFGTCDRDILEVVIPPIDFYFGQKTWGSDGSRHFFEGDNDYAQYELRKFIRLLAGGNPNVVAFLWLDGYEVMTNGGRILVENRDLFSTKKMIISFLGYAKAQFDKMLKSQAYEGYMGEKRKKIVDHFGFDVKNASHLIRLLRMCSEFINTGKMVIKRPDAEELKQIKRGEWQIEKVVEEAERLRLEVEDKAKKSPLPESVDLEQVNSLSSWLLANHFGMDCGFSWEGFASD